MIIKKIVILELEWRENTFPEINLIKTFFVFIILMGKVRGGKTELKNIMRHLSSSLWDRRYGRIYTIAACACMKKKNHTSVSFHIPGSSEFMEKTFQAARITHEIFDHRSLLQNIFLISAKLNFHQPLVCSTVRDI